MEIHQKWELFGGGSLVRPGPSEGHTGPVRTGSADQPPRSMRRISVLGNRKPNALRLLTAVAERVALERGYQVLAGREKETAAVGAPKDVIETLGREADLVLVGSGD